MRDGKTPGAGQQTPGLYDRRALLRGTAAIAAIAGAGWQAGPAQAAQAPDLIASTEAGMVEVTALSDRAVRVRVTPKPGRRPDESPILQAGPHPHSARLRRSGKTMSLALPHLRCEWDADGESLRFYDAQDRLLLAETPGSRRLVPGALDLAIEQGFDSPDDERLYGTGCFQDGYLNIRGLPRRLTQVNTQISLPFVLSSKGYGLLWHNTGMSEFNPPEHRVGLQRSSVDGKAETVDVTTAIGNAQVVRHLAVFEGKFTVTQAGRHAVMLDIGRKMASRHDVSIDGVPVMQMNNLWLPPTSSTLVDLEAGEHKVRVVANADDRPEIWFARAGARTTWRSPVAEAIDYVVIAGPTAAEVMAGYRDITGAAPMMPRWAYGYIHCRERFNTSDEILATAREFRARKLPVDVMVQDWQYWGKYGWNAMRFDETRYPDPAGLIRDLHGMDLRFMLSVWSKIGRETELGKVFAQKGYYIPDTDWIDFFNPDAARFYTENQTQRLASLGIDAWWQDATEPENDDLDGRQTAAGPGGRFRDIYPLKVAKAVYEAQRRFDPHKRVMILTRCAFAGQQRYAAATWSGDIGNDWETLKRQIPAGLNMAAAGYPYWTVDAGGFFRPGDSQYTDPAYHERFLRWFQYATFLPLQRVHGYMTNTEFWHFGDTVETVSRDYLNLRYRLLPYSYSLAAEASRAGTPIIRPLVFGFGHDPAALDEVHSFTFGPAIHVAPVTAPGVTSWPVYLPSTPGGWYDLWTGERRIGGQRHDVPVALERLPLHVPAGSILPLGPVVQSTAEAPGKDIDLYVFAGRDGTFTLYEDDGLSYGYETGGFSTIELGWNEARSELTIGARRGNYQAMAASRRFFVHLVRPGDGPFDGAKGLEVAYSGKAVRINPQSMRTG